jgi:hypothetical protein
MRLTMVSPGDVVRVRVDPVTPIMRGDFIDIVDSKRSYLSAPICRCGGGLVSDGWDVHCSDPLCGITVAHRLTRLAETQFRTVDLVGALGGYQDDLSEDRFSGFEDTPCPFMGLLSSQFWNAHAPTLADILLTKTFGPVSLSTFLVEPLLEEFVDPMYWLTPPIDPYTRAMRDFFRFFDEILNRRSFMSVRQNLFLSKFLWALDLPSLTPLVIQRIIEYERNVDHDCEVVDLYQHILTHPQEMHVCLGVDIHQANKIASEIYMRRFELVDIFSHYGNHFEPGLVHR